MAKGDPRDPNLNERTRLVLAGRNPAASEGGVNPSVQHASTLLIERAGDLYNPKIQTYAREGMSVHRAMKDGLIALEGGAGAELAPSGLSACTLALLNAAKAGQTVLVTDSVYGPTRRFCDRMLARLGVRTLYFDPRIGAEIETLITSDVAAIMLESPGSLTMEIQDVPAIAAIARARGVVTIIDNTWSAGLYFKPFAHKVDYSVQALTKYQAGHADLLMGAVIARTPEGAAKLHQTHKDLGLAVAPDDAYLALRGLRTLPLRLAAQSESALEIARFLSARPQVSAVLHPALANHLDHVLWRRDFTGASGLFAFVLRGVDHEAAGRLLENLSLFGLGFSWGGYESLALPCDPQLVRTAAPWRAEGALIRLSIGLEHPSDLIADLTQALALS